MGARGERSVSVIAPTRPPSAAPQQSACLGPQCSALKSEGRFLCLSPCYLRLRVRWASAEAELRPWARGESVLFPSSRPHDHRRPPTTRSACLGPQCSAPKSEGRFLCLSPCYLRLRVRRASAEAELRPWARGESVLFPSSRPHDHRRRPHNNRHALGRSARP